MPEDEEDVEEVIDRYELKSFGVEDREAGVRQFLRNYEGDIEQATKILVMALAPSREAAYEHYRQKWTR
jgi:hypothetical protein